VLEELGGSADIDVIRSPQTNVRITVGSA